MGLDDDLEAMDRDRLIDEVRRLRAGIREHRDSSGMDLCWHHPKLWGLLPEKVEPEIAVPEWPQFLRGCVRYRQALDEERPDAPRTREEYDPEAERQRNQRVGLTQQARGEEVSDATSGDLARRSDAGAE